MFSLNIIPDKLQRRMALAPAKTHSRISVFGLGYVGVVSTACFAECDHQIIGVDTDSKKIDTILDGRSPIVEPGLNRLLKKGVTDGKIDVTSDVNAAVSGTDISFVSVGTPSTCDGGCDLKYLRQVSAQIGAALADKTEYHVVVYRSTVPPGTTRDVMLPILEQTSGKKAGKDFGVCFHPEFLRESTAISDFYEPPKTVVGGIDKRSREAVTELYADIDDNIIESDLEVAEMVKYVDNSWHALKVSFSNEIGKICQAMSIDSHQVMDIFTKDTKLNISSYYMKPGFAFGGSCLPKDVRGINHLAHDLNVSAPVLGSIIGSNNAQISHVAKLVKATMPRRVAFLGITFKAETDDLRESPILPLIADLLAEGVEVKFYDPNFNVDTSVRHHLAHSKHEKGSIDELMSKLPSMMCKSIDAACKDVCTIVVCHDTDDFREAVTNRNTKQTVIDLVRIYGGECGWPEMAEAGMDDYVQKPASTETLEAKIKHWVNGMEGSLHILLAEDDLANAAVIRAKLAKLGHSVRVVSTGVEAVEAASSETYHLVFMDISMPEMCGKEATSRIRALPGCGSHVPIVALTAHAAPEESKTYTGICW